MIDLEDVRFRYPDSDFELVVGALRVARGETVALVGPSGSGKTTLLNLIAGVQVPEVGRVVVDGRRLAATDDAERRSFRLNRIGMVFQSFELLDYLSVLDNILLPIRIGAADDVTDLHRQRAKLIAGQVGLSDKLRRYPGQLSQGERQRVAVCRALLLLPPLVLADEPTGNLDPINKHAVLDLLLAYARNEDATLIAVTHDHELLDHFERVIDFDSLGATRQ